MTPGDAAFMNPSSMPDFAIAAFMRAMSAWSGSSVFTRIGPTQRGRR